MKSVFEHISGWFRKSKPAPPRRTEPSDYPVDYPQVFEVNSPAHCDACRGNGEAESTWKHMTSKHLDTILCDRHIAELLYFSTDYPGRRSLVSGPGLIAKAIGLHDGK